jgi:outer membrane protein assembly factor BamB
MDTGDVFGFNASGCGQALCEPLWKASFGPPNSTGALDLIASPPAVANGVLYVGTVADPVFGGGSLFAVDARTGARLWSGTTGSTEATGNNGLSASPVVANGVVFVISEEGQLSTFRATGCGGSTCKPFWTASFRNNFGSGYSVTVLDGRVYLTTPGGTLYALRLS